MRRIVVIALWALFSTAMLAQNASTADALFKQANWEEALKQYKRLHRQDPGNQVYTYRYARCLGELNRPDEAIPLFEQVSTIVLKDFFIAREYYKVYRFADAVDALDTYLSNIQPDNERYAKAEALRAEAAKAARWLAKTEDVQLFSVTNVPLAHWRDNLGLSAEAGTVTPEGVHINSLGDRRIYADSLGHVYVQTKLMDEWSEPELLPFGGINPFMAADGITIYYSDRNADGMGGYDICMSRLNTATQTYLLPSIIGMPFSSTGDDIFFAIDETAGVGVFVSVLNDSTASIYRFVPNDEKQFLRDVDDATRRQMAQRLLIRPVTGSLATTDEAFLSSSPLFESDADAAHPHASADATPAGRSNTASFRFVLNDSTVYTSLEQFRSEEAKRLFVHYQELSAQLEQKQRDLERQRKAYAHCESNEERSCIAPLIMRLEQEIAKQKREHNLLPNQIRTLESQAH
ncbi:MAG: hypothetical protein IKN59_01525 [Paludibacteraceae bacterium]|nr:hypothetical protein [Paludibacteraceae bacterium]